MEFLDIEFFGNTVLNWAIALGVIIGSFIAVKILYWIFSKIIKRATAKTKNKLDDVLVDSLEKPIMYFVFILAYWFAIHFLNFPQEKILLALEKIAYIALAINLTSIIVKVVDALIVYVVMPLSEKNDGVVDEQLIQVVRKF
jgi:MscS family membrane protein